MPRIEIGWKFRIFSFPTDPQHQHSRQSFYNCFVGRQAAWWPPGMEARPALRPARQQTPHVLRRRHQSVRNGPPRQPSDRRGVSPADDRQRRSLLRRHGAFLALCEQRAVRGHRQPRKRLCSDAQPSPGTSFPYPRGSVPEVSFSSWLCLSNFISFV